jgi:chromosome segregation ATPase
MIEAWMYLAIGFLIACLFWIAFVPLIHNRAVRLTARRRDQTGPQSLAEVKADKDHLRAEHAVAVSRLQTQLLRLQTGSTTQRAELGRKSQAIDTLKASLDEQTNRAQAAETRIEGYQDRIAALEQELAEKTARLVRQDVTLASNAAQLGELGSNLDEQQLTGESRRVEVAALMTQVEALKTQIDDATRAKAETDDTLTAQRLIIGDVEAKLAQSERELAARTAEFEAARTRIRELERALTPAETAETLPPNPVSLVPSVDTERPSPPLAVN